MSEQAVSPEELLEQVEDKQTFIKFVEALAAEREQAQAIEDKNPAQYRVNGALGWENGDISSFLYAALEYFQPGLFRQPEQNPSWKMFAEFLYFGKIYE